MIANRIKKSDPLDFLNKNNQIIKSIDSAALLAIDFDIKLNFDGHKEFDKHHGAYLISKL